MGVRWWRPDVADGDGVDLPSSSHHRLRYVRGEGLTSTLVRASCSKSPPPGADETRDARPRPSVIRRGLRFRKRDDYAVGSSGGARHLDDIARVDRIRSSSVKFYTHWFTAIVDLATRRRIVEHLQAARIDDARTLLDERLALYARMEQDG